MSSSQLLDFFTLRFFFPFIRFAFGLCLFFSFLFLLLFSSLLNLSFYSLCFILSFPSFLVSFSILALFLLALRQKKKTKKLANVFKSSPNIMFAFCWRYLPAFLAMHDGIWLCIRRARHFLFHLRTKGKIFSCASACLPFHCKHFSLLITSDHSFFAASNFNYFISIVLFRSNFIALWLYYFDSSFFVICRLLFSL